MPSKRHHYVPKAYLKHFCDGTGKIHVCRKDEPEAVRPSLPSNVATHKHYYAQPKPDGGVDHDALEGLFSKYESKWPGIVDKFRAGENVNEYLGDIFAFVGLQRARVPAMRDAVERVMAERVTAITKQLDRDGKLPELPPALEHIYDRLQVSIDPHQSIHAIVTILQAVGKFMDRLGFEVACNDTGLPFLTSDNPVMWFDPSVPDAELQPYAVQPRGAAILLLPVAPDLMLIGDTTSRERYVEQGLVYTKLEDAGVAARFNEMACRFAYDAVYGSTPGISDLVRKHADTCPVLKSTMVSGPASQLTHHQFVWDKRPIKPKWMK